MSLIIDHLNIAYRMKTPHPFDSKLFLAFIDGKFKKKPIKTLSITPEGLATVEEFQYVFKQATLNFSPERGIVGVAGSEYSDITEGFEFIVNILKDEMKIDFDQRKHLEVIAKGRYKPKIKPLKRIANSYNSKITQFFSDFFGGESETPMSIRICSEGAIEEDVSFRDIINWSEFRIEPMILNPNFYYWEMVYRNKDVEKVLDIWKDIPSKIEKLLTEFDQKSDEV